MAVIFGFFTEFYLVERRRARFFGEIAREEEILGVSVGNVDDLILFPLSLRAIPGGKPEMNNGNSKEADLCM